MPFLPKEGNRRHLAPHADRKQKPFQCRSASTVMCRKCSPQVNTAESGAMLDRTPVEVSSPESVNLGPGVRIETPEWRVKGLQVIYRLTPVVERLFNEVHGLRPALHIPPGVGTGAARRDWSFHDDIDGFSNIFTVNLDSSPSRHICLVLDPPGLLRHQEITLFRFGFINGLHSWFDGDLLVSSTVSSRGKAEDPMVTIAFGRLRPDWQIRSPRASNDAEAREMVKLTTNVPIASVSPLASSCVQ
ncbi:hypothetical protein HOY80DRAFT_1040724 [Tuber brumale]|nr:hypothetical protein HOY80DRAFT_1040724 [Tuber brumale]